jgi:hypothetical protein
VTGSAHECFSALAHDRGRDALVLALRGRQELCELLAESALLA